MRFAFVYHHLSAVVRFAHGNSPKSPPPTKKYQATLLAEFEKEGGATRAFAKRFLAFAEENIKETAAADALFWVVENVRGRRETAASNRCCWSNTMLASGTRWGSGCEVVSRAQGPVGAEKVCCA